MDGTRINILRTRGNLVGLFQNDPLLWEPMRPLVEMLLNLDRPVMQSEVDQAAYAMSQADMLIRVAPESADGHVLKGQLYASLDRLELAGASIDTAIAIEPENSFAWVRRGLLLYNTYQSTEEPADLDAAFAAAAQLDASPLDGAHAPPPTAAQQEALDAGVRVLCEIGRAHV